MNYIDSGKVAILLCTCNGETFLVEQLESLCAQSHKNWIVIASDDGSSDSTLDILYAYQEKWPPGKMMIRQGAQNGFCHNFLSLACDPNIKADYYAFCDQDDVWLPSKLSVAISNIRANQSAKIPYIYCGRSKYVTDKLLPCGLSPLFVFPRTFRNALVQSIAGGNTMVFNQATKILLEQAGVMNVASHDWWIYQLVTGAEGICYYDPVPQILYRQHANSLVGGSNSLNAIFRRMRMLLEGRFRDWNSLNIKALKKSNMLLTKNNNEILELFTSIRSSRIKKRFRLMDVCGLYRQTRRGSFSLFLAVLLNKV